jgi:predicted phosphodiesterase
VRYGVVSDVHANLPALDAALELLATEGVDAYLCPGDLVGYGPQPNECVERVLDLGAACVAGNHDLIAIGELGDDRCDLLARQTLRWTRGALSPQARHRLAALPRRHETGDGIVMAHGSLHDPQEYVETPAQAAAQLAAAPGARVVLLGHTHRPLAVQEGGRELEAATVPLAARVLLNPGSTGQSRDRRALARCLVLDLERGEATFHAIAYDTAATRRALRRAGLPAFAAHPPSRPRWRRAASRLRKALPRGR